METTYELSINGPDSEMVEQAVRIMDHLVRQWYNVYGGCRVYSGKGADNEYYIRMEYTAYWASPTDVVYWLGWRDIERLFFRRLAKLDRKDELAVYTKALPMKG